MSHLKWRVQRKKMVIKEVNRQKRLSWCQEKQRWSVENNWKKIIFSAESKIMIGGNERVYVWRKASEGWWPDLGNRSLKLWYWDVFLGSALAGTVTAVNGNINAIKYQDIQENHLWPVVAQYFPLGGLHFFKMIMLQSTAQDRLSLIKPKTIYHHSLGPLNHQISIS